MSGVTPFVSRASTSAFSVDEQIDEQIDHFLRVLVGRMEDSPPIATCIVHTRPEVNQRAHLFFVPKKSSDVQWAYPVSRVIEILGSAPASRGSSPQEF